MKANPLIQVKGEDQKIMIYYSLHIGMSRKVQLGLDSPLSFKLDVTM
jgi:hypothetical protein